VFEGLLSPWHLVILAVVLFIVISPRKVADRWHHLRDSARRLTDDTENSASPSEGESTKRSFAFRIGRLLRRR
jgi:Sec-independent protein translocase protein TatA